MLPCAGYSSTFPHAIAFAPTPYLDMGLYHLKALHLASQVETLLQHIRMKDSVGQTALIMLQWAQLAAGTSVPVLEGAGRLPYIEGSWIANIRDGLITINAKIHIPLQWVRKPQRVGDIAIMEVFRQSDLIDLELT
eukprot:672542-Ditylum_brightwellii.AAC.1